MLNDIISVKHNIVFKRKKHFFFVDLNEKRRQGKKGGSQILGWMYGYVINGMPLTEMAVSKIFLLCFEDVCCYHGK